MPQENADGMSTDNWLTSVYLIHSTALTTVHLTATHNFVWIQEYTRSERLMANVRTEQSIPNFPIGGQFSLGETRQVDLRYPRPLLLLKQ